jgi:magnesium chelatase subunit H
MQSKGLDGAAARLFSNPAGDFGSLVGDQVGAGTWTNSSELGETWERRNSFSYGAGAENGVSRPDVLKSLLNSTDRIVQEVDCVEYGLTDIQEYFGNTGGLLRAAENNRQAGGERGRGRVGVSIIEAFEKEVKSRELEDTLRVEYRSKLLNPAWAAAMVKQGSGGAYEISGRLTAMVGWAGVAGNEAVPSFVWEGAAERYALDAKMADFLKSQNPEAFRNIVKRLLEGDGRGMWSPSVEVKERLLELFSDAEDAIEGVE